MISEGFFAACPNSAACPPIDPEIHHSWHEGDYARCEEEYRNTLSVCARCPNANVQFVGALGAQGKYEEADAATERLFEFANTNSELASVCVLKGSILMECVGPEDAEPWLVLASDLEDYPGHYSALANAYWARRKRKHAAQLAEKALSMLPHDPAIIAESMDILVKSGRADEAKGYLRKMAERPHHIPHYHAAVAKALADAGLHREAIRLARRTARVHPESPYVAYTVSTIYMGARQLSSAKAELKRLLKLDPASHGKYAVASLYLIAETESNTEDMIKYAVQAVTQFNDEDATRLLRRATKAITEQVRGAGSALDSVNADYNHVKLAHESLQASLAGYDLTEGGTNLEYALLEGEGWHIEFMDRMPEQARDLGKEIAAMSSQDGGGTVFLGVDDNDDTVGVSAVGTLKERDVWRHRIAQISTKVVQPPNPVTVYFNQRNGVDVVKIWIPDGTAPIYYVDNIPYIRNLDESRKATPDEVSDYVSRRSARGGRSNGHGR